MANKIIDAVVIALSIVTMITLTWANLFTVSAALVLVFKAIWMMWIISLAVNAFYPRTKTRKSA